MKIVARTVNAPDQEWLSRKEAAQWMGISVRLFDFMLQGGKLPPGKEFGHRTVKWHWQDVFAASVMMNWPEKPKSAL